MSHVAPQRLTLPATPKCCMCWARFMMCWQQGVWHLLWGLLPALPRARAQGFSGTLVWGAFRFLSCAPIVLTSISSGVQLMGS
jgi:hypothetical protein